MSVGFLLDTHILLQWLYEPEVISTRTEDIIDDTKIDVYVSGITAFEISTKYRLGKLPKAKPIIGRFDEIVTAENFFSLPVLAKHGDLAGTLGWSHTDPWDRLLVAQANAENLTMITDDIKIRDYDGVLTLS